MIDHGHHQISMCSNYNLLKSLYNNNFIHPQECFKPPSILSMPEPDKRTNDKETDTQKYRKRLALHYSNLASRLHKCKSKKHASHKAPAKKQEGARNSTIALIDLKTGEEAIDQDRRTGDAQAYKRARQKLKNKYAKKENKAAMDDSDPDRDNWGLGRRFALQELEQSQYLRPMRFKYRQYGLDRSWDAMLAHDSVYVVLFNTTRNKLIFVRQFRPAVYYEDLRTKKKKEPKIGDVLETFNIPARNGVTLELCAGILDKDGLSSKEIAKEEIYEECGYDVPLDSIEEVQWCLANSGTSGERMGLFYAEVTDGMKVKGAGGGNRKEGENIQVAEMSVEEASAFLYTGEILLKTTSPTLYGVLWFLQNKAPAPPLVKDLGKAPANSGLVFAAGVVCGGLVLYGMQQLFKGRF